MLYRMYLLIGCQINVLINDVHVFVLDLRFILLVIRIILKSISILYGIKHVLLFIYLVSILYNLFSIQTKSWDISVFIANGYDCHKLTLVVNNNCIGEYDTIIVSVSEI